VIQKLGGAALCRNGRSGPLHGFPPAVHFVLILWLGFIFCSFNTAKSAPVVTTDDPSAFFNGIAARLLKSELNLDLGGIQIYPTNQYTPAVHRLLQLTANLYDAATNRTYGVAAATNGFPTVFRPLFLTTYTNGPQVFITAYEEVTDASPVLSPPPIHELGTTNDLPVNTRDLVYSVPLIIGARKGFPNFNEFEMMTAAQFTRKLEFVRYSLPGTTRYPNETNQMFVVGISNVFGVELWNSYKDGYPRNLSLVMAGKIDAYITNELGKTIVLTSGGQPVTGTFNASNFWSTVGPWPGSTNRASPSYSGTFKMPWGVTNWWHLPNAQFWQGSSPLDETFVPMTGTFESRPNARFHVPRWWLNIRTTLRCALVDTDVSPARIVDFVALSTNESPIDLTYNLMVNGDYTASYSTNASYIPNGSSAAMWATNRLNLPGSGNDESTPTFGIMNQIRACMSQPPNFIDMPGLNWYEGGNAYATDSDRLGAINFFRTNFAMLPPWPGIYSGPLYLTNRFYTPYVPSRSIFFYTSWQANDPLVHYTISDLHNTKTLGNRIAFDTNSAPATLANIRKLNARYEPWGNGYGNSGNPNFLTVLNLAVKDPLLRSSDEWDFPIGPSASLAWLGKVHRGTPWQTINLKSANPDPTAWEIWLCPISPLQCAIMNATNDWRIVSKLLAWLSPETPTQLRSLNQQTVQDWQGALDGFSVLTNTLSDSDFPTLPPPRFDTVVMGSNSPQAAIIANAIVSTRFRQPRSHFGSVGDILTTPELSLSSPWLHIGGDQINYGINDAAYETIPSQLLPTLKPDSIGSVTISNGIPVLEFTGLEGYAYRVEQSADLANWMPLTTNYVFGGVFAMELTPQPAATVKFYRSVLLP